MGQSDDGGTGILTGAGPLGWAGFLLLITALPLLAGWQLVRSRSGKAGGQWLFLWGAAGVVALATVLFGLDAGWITGDVAAEGVGEVPDVLVAAVGVAILVVALFLGAHLDQHK